jgi:hypothetical protein
MSQTEYPGDKILKLAIKVGDATAYAHYMQWRSGYVTYEEMLEKLTLQLMAEKKNYLDMAVDATQRAMPRALKI